MDINLEFTLRDWNREYGTLQTVEHSIGYYNMLYKGKIPKKLLVEKLVTLETWANYAYICNKGIVEQIQNKKLNPNKEFKQYSDICEKESRELYVTALLSENKQPYACIRFSNMFVVIEYIDEYNRVYMTYSFRTEYGKQDLFLYELEYFVYPEDSKEFDIDNRDYVSYYFTSEGKLTLTKEYNVGTPEHTREIYKSETL
jgi:hypothetical protein